MEGVAATYGKRCSHGCSSWEEYLMGGGAGEEGEAVLCQGGSILTVATAGDPRSTKWAGIHPHQSEKPAASWASNSRAHIRRYSPPPETYKTPGVVCD